MVTVQALCALIAVVLMFVAAFTSTPRVALSTLAWAFALVAFFAPVIAGRF